MTITNNVSNYNDVLLVSQSSLGIRSVFSLHSVAVLFMSYWCFDRLNLFQHPDSEISSQ
jgi:hypothetical protein